MRLRLVALAVLALLARTAAAQDSAAVTVLTSAELTAAIDRADTTAVADARVKLLPITGQFNVSISMVRRSKVSGRTPPDAIEHDDITEVYQIREGWGILVTGGTLTHARSLPADGPIVRRLVGPSSIGDGIVGGRRQEVGPGDIVIIPPGTPHGFVELLTPRVTYALVRIDPRRVLRTD